jgi:hypothetical protein
MTPLALKLEAGGESRAPMAVVIIGGIASSTILSLVLVPVMYTLLEDGKSLVLAALRWRPVLRRRAAAASAAAHWDAERLGRATAPGHERTEASAPHVPTHAQPRPRPIQGGSLDE